MKENVDCVGKKRFKGSKDTQAILYHVCLCQNLKETKENKHKL